MLIVNAVTDALKNSEIQSLNVTRDVLSKTNTPGLRI
jgi:hypothetical protein